VVECNGEILEKPQTKDHAFNMVSNLIRQRYNKVHTALIVLSRKSASDDKRPFQHSLAPHLIFDPKWWVEVHVESTQVEMIDNVDDAVVQAYVDSGEPMDKAGGYGYQGLAMVLVKRIDGCFYNVVGKDQHVFYISQKCKQVYRLQNFSDCFVKHFATLME
jgi:septum formation protein